jgi:hypothetical protein
MAGSSDEPEDRSLRVMARWRQTGRVLVEALPYILKYDQKTIVVASIRWWCMAAARRSAPCSRS